MQQHDLRPPKGATHKRKRIGRGNASGHGTYSTRGMKGQKARSGGGVRPHFEGGQLPFVRRMAYKRGFRNPFRVDYEEVNVGDLGRFGLEAGPEEEAAGGDGADDDEEEDDERQLAATTVGRKCGHSAFSRVDSGAVGNESAHGAPGKRQARA